MKSFWPFNSAFVLVSPLATLMTKFENFFAHVLDVGFARDNAAGVDIDDVVHALGQGRISGELHHRSDRIPRRRAQAGGKQDHIGSRAHLRGYAFHVTARRTLQM